jgi:hypothetical protein
LLHLASACHQADFMTLKKYSIANLMYSKHAQLEKNGNRLQLAIQWDKTKFNRPKNQPNQFPDSYSCKIQINPTWTQSTQNTTRHTVKTVE